MGAVAHAVAAAAAPLGLALTPARGPRRAGPSPMVRVDPGAGAFRFDVLSALPAHLQPGDLVVVNDAATLPAALHGLDPEGRPIELRLARRLDAGTADACRWLVGVLGAGDWRTATERRPLPPPLAVGAVITLGPELRATVDVVVGTHLAEVTLAAPRRGWLDAVLRHGEPVRYSYLGGSVGLGAFQTAFASRPWACESPSAALPLTVDAVLGLRAAGVGVAALTHAAGLSSIDGGPVDASLPLPERSDLPQDTVDAVLATRARGGRVLAVGTTVVRALEGRVDAAGALVAGIADTGLVIGPSTPPPRVVDGLLTKLHAPEESHFAVLAAFAPPDLLVRAFAAASDRGFRNHEFGDTALIW